MFDLHGFKDDQTLVPLHSVSKPNRDSDNASRHGRNDVVIVGTSSQLTAQSIVVQGRGKLESGFAAPVRDKAEEALRLYGDFASIQARADDDLSVTESD